MDSSKCDTVDYLKRMFTRYTFIESAKPASVDLYSYLMDRIKWLMENPQVIMYMDGCDMDFRLINALDIGNSAKLIFFHLDNLFTLSDVKCTTRQTVLFLNFLIQGREHKIECPICLESATNLVMCRQCGTEFCMTCLRKVDSCPYCRLTFNYERPKQTSDSAIASD